MSCLHVYGDLTLVQSAIVFVGNNDVIYKNTVENDIFEHLVSA